MAPLEWDELMEVTPDALENDDDLSEDMFENLQDFEADGESDATRLVQLFKVTQSVMKIKQSQLNVLEKEIEDMATEFGERNVKKDQEIEALKGECQTLRRENKDLQRMHPEGGGSGGGTHETRFLRDELMKFEEDIAQYQRDMKEKDQQLVEERELSEKYISRTEEAEKELRELRKESEQMREDIRDYQRQLEAQRESMLAKRDEDYEVRDKISGKNKLINMALEENKNLAETNVELEEKIERLKKEMAEGQTEVEHTTDQILKLRMVVEKSDEMAEHYRKKTQALQCQLDDLNEQVKSKTDADDEIMVQVNNKVEEWKGVLADKDERIYSLQEQLVQMREQLVAANMDTEKASVSMLTKALEERDKQIAVLQVRVDEAAIALEGNAALMEDFNSHMNKNTNDPQMKKITTLKNTLQSHETQLKDADKRALEAEEDARAKDKQLSEVLERMSQYEQGIYGLPEAVTEIKDLKVQSSVKDRQVEELTQYINRVEMQLNDLNDENDDYRQRLGLGVREEVDLSEYRKKKNVRQQEDRALNHVLQKEIERLEEERISLKQQMRKIAQSSGQRAVALGLNADDMQEVNSLIEQLKAKRDGQEQASVTKIKSLAEREALKLKNQQLDKEVVKNEQKVEKLTQEVIRLKTKSTELEDENKGLEKGMREILDSLKEQSVSTDGLEVIQCPTLERMLAAMDSRNLIGTHDTSLYLKAQVDNLTGHNEELRRTLREIRFEATKANVELDKAQRKMVTMDEEIKELRESGAGAWFQTMSLPEGMAVSSSEVIASINEHLVQALQELSLKEGLLEKMETTLVGCQRKIAVMRHQKGMVYKEYHEQKQILEEARSKLEEELKHVQGLREDDQVRLQEFDRLVDNLSQDEPELRRRQADLTRKITVLRVNEKALARRYNAMQDIEANLRKENTKVKTDMIAMETAVTERLGYLQRHKDMATFKIAALQKSLEDSVPASDLEAANKQYTELTEKYRDMLERSNTLVARSEESSGFEVEVKHLQDEKNALQQELTIEKEKLHTLEAAFENMRKQGTAHSRDLKDHDVLSISKKITTLEMKELNERQRAEHANRMYNQQKSTIRSLEDRNMELEEKFAELTRMSLESQKVERELRDDLANSVTKEVSDRDRKRIAELEEIEVNLRDEMSKLKEISDVAMTQVRAMDCQQQSREKECTSLRQQLIDFQAQSDEKTVIGKLHRHIVQLQVSEGLAVRKLEDSRKQVNKMEAQLLRTEQKVDQKDQTIYHNRLESHSKGKHMKRTIQDLRKKYSGAVPLSQQEKFSQSMVKLQEDKKQIEDDLMKTNAERRNVEDKLAELEMQHSGLQELISTLQDNRGAQKVAEWHAKMEQVRLNDLRLKREIDRHKAQIKFLDNILKKHEVEVVSLEEEKVRLTRDFETRELEWEHREVELERIIRSMEKQQAAIAGAANQFEEAVGTLPDPSWPVPQQLDHAVTTIKRNVKMILDAKAEVEFSKQRVDEAEAKCREKEKEVVARDKVITELRLRMPASADRDEMILRAQKSANEQAPDEEDYETRKAVRVATETVSGLQKRLHQKEIMLNKQKELLRQTREDLETAHKRHEKELRSLQKKLHSKHDDAFSKFKKAVKDSLNKPDAVIPTNEQLKRLNELEDMLAEQDNSIAAMREKLNQSRQEVQEWKYRYEDAMRHHEEEKETLLGEHGDETSEMQEKISRLELHLEEKQGALRALEEELEVQKEANTRAPTTTMKNMMERLKNQLSLKEKQHQALSKALMELRADLVSQAGEDTRANADLALAELNVQKIVDKRTKELTERIDELSGQMNKFKRDAKKYKDKESVVSTELEETKSDLSKKEAQVRKLKHDKQRLEAEVEELENKVSRISSMSKQKSSNEAVQHEMDELRRKNRLLTDEVKRSKHQAEKPYEQQAGKDTQPQPSREDGIARWEESKKWQKLADRLKMRLKEKEVEIEKVTRASDLLKNGLDRANKDKECLEAKLKSLSKIDAPLIKAVSQPSVSSGPQNPHTVQELKKKNHELEDQVANLKRELTQGRDKAYEEVNMRNKFLLDRMEQMEQQMAKKGGRPGASQDLTVSQNTYRELAGRESDLQKQLIKISEENIELRFEVEQSNKDIPRLKKRIDDLQKYVEILKVEKEEMKMMKSSSHSLASLASSYSSSNIRRIGDSGKSPQELEKTIALLKKVIEKTQSENQQLKQAPGVVSNETLKHLQTENQGLKSQLEELRHNVGANLSERYVSHQKGTARVMADYEKLRKDLMKEKDANEGLRVRIREQELTVEHLEQQLQNTEKQLVAESKKPTLSSLDTKEWKAAVVSKMSEEKVKAMMLELDNKNEQLRDVHQLFKEAATREQQLIREKEVLEEKVKVLERFPPGTEMKDAEIMRSYQQAKLRCDRLESEKKELMHEIKVLRQQICPDGSEAPDLTEDDILNKVRLHNTLMTQNVELTTKLKAAELQRDKVAMQLDTMKQELSNFGPDFFDEIEDLKFNYREAVQRNVQYEEQLSKLSKQFGVSVDIPAV